MNAKSVASIAITILIITATVYVVLQPGMASDAAPHVAATPAAEDAGKIDSVAHLVGGLEARLQKDPDDAKDWLLLAKSYDHLGDNKKALAAYQRAVALGMSDAEMEMKLVAKSLSEEARQ